MRQRLLIIFALLSIPSLLFAGGGREESEEQSGSPETEITGSESTDDRSDGESGPAATAGQDAETTPLGTLLDTSDPARYVATVNGVGILRSDYDLAIRRTVEAYLAQGQRIPEAQMPLLREQLLDQLVAEELLYQEALGRNYEAEPGAVDLQYEQMRSQFGTEEAWADALEANDTNEEDLRFQIQRNSIIQQLITQRLSEAAPVSQDDIQTFYDDNPSFFQTGEQVNARHILISTEGLESDEDLADARSRAEAIREDIVAGADFAETAAEKSEGPSASQGGDLGTFGRGQMVAPFDQAVFALEVGEISDIVETQFGYHIIQVTEKQEAVVAPIEDVSQSIEQYLLQEKQGQLLEEYVEQLREDATIVVNTQGEDSAN